MSGSDWYEQGFEYVLDKVATDAGITKEQARKVYSCLSELELIDYDVEKEVFYDLINP